MLLAVNANNTNTVVGLCEPAADRLVTSWRVSTRRDRTPDEWYSLIASLLGTDGYRLDAVDAVILASVVPSVTTWLCAMARERLGLEPVVVGVELDLGARARVDFPSEVGADRLANTVAAFRRYGGPAIVVDFGTATNFDVVSAEGDFLGGAIAPGLTVSLEALTARAARLFSVDVSFPEKAIGTNTVTNIQAGTVLGHLAMVEGMLERIQAELGGHAAVVATGGHAALFVAASSLIEHHAPDLTLDGLNLIYQRVAAARR
jgi:type III pantothenate kinase